MGWGRAGEKGAVSKLFPLSTVCAGKGLGKDELEQELAWETNGCV